MADLENKYPDFMGKIKHARQLGIAEDKIEQLLTQKYQATPVALPEEDLTASSVLTALSAGVFDQDPTIISNIPLVGKPLDVLLNILELPQAAATAAIGDYTDTGKDPGEGFLSRLARSQNPSELLEWEGIPGLAADIILDPLNLTTGLGFRKAIKAVGQERKFAQMAGVVKPAAKNKTTKRIAGSRKADDLTGSYDDIDDLFPNRQKRIEEAEEIALNDDDYTKLFPSSRKLDRIAGEQFKALAEKKQIEFFSPKETKIPLNVQIINQINLGNISFDEAAKELIKKGVSKKEAISYLAGKTVESQKAVTAAAQTLGYQRQFLPRLEKIIKASKDPEYQKLFDEVMANSDKVDGDGIFKRFYKSTTNIWRASLVSQLGTGIRNSVTAAGRMGLDVAQKALDAGIQKLPGVEAKTNMFDAVEPMLKLFGKNKQVTEKILESFPRQKDRLLNIISSDVTTGKGKKFTDRYTRFINTFNLFQERIFRRAVFQAEISRVARKKGLSVDDLVKPENVNRLKETDIKEAVEKALDITFASAPQSKLGKSFVNVINEAPGALLLMPFPRFLVNSMRFFYEFSPTGMMKLVNPNGKAFKKILRGDTAVVSKSILGSAMLGAAWEMRNSEHAGEKWYEARWGDKTIDLRPFGPFSGYLFIADIVKRHREGTLNTLRAKDIASGVLGANVRAGTGLYLVDTLIEGLSGLRDPDTFVEKFAQFTGEFAGGFFTPLQQLNDVFAQYDESRRAIKETRSGDPLNDLLAPSIARIPGLESRLPAAEIPTREAPLEKPAPALKQLGVSLRAAKNPAEKELDRLGFTRQEIAPSTGNTRANNLIAKHIGPLVENFLGRMVESEGYQSMSEAQKGAYIQKVLKRLRGLARRRAITENPQLFRKLKRRSRRHQRVIDEQT